MKAFVTAVVLGWFASVVALGAAGAFVRPPHAPPLPILFGAAGPILVFLALDRSWPAFRAILRGADLRLLTAIQAWRAGGLTFLALHAHGILPGPFAWLAGLGDIAIGVTAPWVVLALLRTPAFATTRSFAVWNGLGILDLVVAVGSGALSSGFFGGLAGEVTTGAMSELPLVVIPAFLVPLFVMLHITALVQASHAAARVAAEARRRGPTVREIPAFGA